MWTLREEFWYFCLLLTKICEPTSFTALKTVNGNVYNTFSEACVQYVFLNDDNEWHEAMEENKQFSMPDQLRQHLYI